MSNFAPAYQARLTAAADNDAYLAEKAERAEKAARDTYARWIAVTDITKACTEVDKTVNDIFPLLAGGAEPMTRGAIYRRLAEGHKGTHERLAGVNDEGVVKCAWWDDKCTAALRLLWQAANGRAKGLGY